MVAGFGGELFFGGAVEGEGVDGSLGGGAGGEGVVDQRLAVRGDIHTLGVDPVEGAEDFDFAAGGGDEGDLADVVFAEEEGQYVLVVGGPGGGLDEAGFGVFEEGFGRAAGDGEDAEFVEAFVVEPGVGEGLGVAGEGGEVGELFAAGGGELGGLAGGGGTDGEIGVFNEADVFAVGGRGAKKGDGGIGKEWPRRGVEQRRGQKEITNHDTSVYAGVSQRTCTATFSTLSRCWLQRS